MNGASTFYSRKAAKLAKKNNQMNLLKNLRVFASSRDTLSFPVYRGQRFMVHDYALSIKGVARFGGQNG